MTRRVTEFIGMENMFLWMHDEPDHLHRMMKLLHDDYANMLDWHEKEKLLSLNNENDYIGSGGVGYTCEVPEVRRRSGSVACSWSPRPVRRVVWSSSTEWSVSDSGSGGTDTDMDRAKPGSFRPDSGSSGCHNGSCARAAIPATPAARRPTAPATGGARAATIRNRFVHSFLSTISCLGAIATKKTTQKNRAVVEFSKAEFLERAKAESWLCSTRAVGKQNDREFLLVWALLEYRDAPVQVFTENGPGAGDGLSRESVLSEVDAATDRDRDGLP